MNRRYWNKVIRKRKYIRYFVPFIGFQLGFEIQINLNAESWGRNVPKVEGETTNPSMWEVFKRRKFKRLQGSRWFYSDLKG